MTTILGIFDDPLEARRAMETLQASTLNLEDVSIVSRATESGELVDSGDHITAGEGAAIGAVWGGLVGLAALLIPGVGPFVAGGALFAALTGAATGAVVGGIAGALIDSTGIPEEEARHYEAMIQGGKTLIAVKARPEDAPEVRRILASAGADSLREGQAEVPTSPVHVAMYEQGRRVDTEREIAYGDTTPTVSTYGARGIYDTPTTTSTPPAPGMHDYSAESASHDPYATREMPPADTTRGESSTWTKGEWVGEGQGKGPHKDTGTYDAHQFVGEGQGEGPRNTGERYSAHQWVGEGQGEGPDKDAAPYTPREWVGEGQGDEHVTPDRPNIPPPPRRDTNLPEPDDTTERKM